MFGGSACAGAALLPPAGEGWQSLAAVRDGNAPPLGKPPARGGTGIPPCPSPRCRSRSREEPGSAWRSGRRRKRSWSNASLHPDAVGTIRHGTAVTTSQKMIACPKASPNRRLHRYVDLRQRGGPLHRSAPHTFLFRPCTAHFSFGKTERGPRRAPRGGERRRKGAGAVFAAGGNGAERTLRRRQWGAHPPWKRPPAGAESPVAAVRRPKSSPGG